MSALKYRCFYADWATAASLLAYMLALAATLLWAYAAPGSYAAWRELPAAAIPLAGVWLPAGWAISQALMGTHDDWAGGATVTAAALFWCRALGAPMLPYVILHGTVVGKRYPLHCAVQAGLAGAVLWRAVLRPPGICGTPLAGHPLSQRQISAVHAALRFCGHLYRVPSAWLGPERLTPLVQCRAVASVLILMLGLVLPLVCTAVWQHAAYVQFAAAGAAAEPDGTRAEAPTLQLRSAAERAVRWVLRVLSLAMALSLAATVWDICIKLQVDG